MSHHNITSQLKLTRLSKFLAFHWLSSDLQPFLLVDTPPPSTPTLVHASSAWSQLNENCYSPKSRYSRFDCQHQNIRNFSATACLHSPVLSAMKNDEQIQNISKLNLFCGKISKINSGIEFILCGGVG